MGEIVLTAPSKPLKCSNCGFLVALVIYDGIEYYECYHCNLNKKVKP